MFTRCKNRNWKTTVCKEWHNFENFMPWFNENYIEGYHLDKDLLAEGNTVYSPDRCVFVPQWLNALLPKTKNKFTGIRKSGNGFRSQCSINGKNVCGKTRNTQEEAYSDYLQTKSMYIMERLERPGVPKVLIQPLTERAEKMFLKSLQITNNNL